MEQTIIKTKYVAEWFYQGNIQAYWSRNLKKFLSGEQLNEKTVFDQSFNAVQFVTELSLNNPGVRFRVVKLTTSIESFYQIKTDKPVITEKKIAEQIDLEDQIKLEQFKPGSFVQRVNPGDYTHGRTGEVLTVNESTGRVRVKWNVGTDQSNKKKFMRTWVTFKQLMFISNQKVSQ